MSRTTRVAAIILALILLSLPATVPADDAMDLPAEGDVGRIRKKVEALRAWRLTEELNLDQETSGRLFPVIREADEQRLALERENRRLIRTLNQELQSRDVDQNEVDRIIDQLISNRLEQARNEERHLNKIRSILTPEMSARYIMFQVRFQRELRNLVNERVRDRRDRAGPDGRDRSPGRAPSDEGRDGYGSGASSGGGSGSGPGGDGGGGGGRR